MEKIMDINVESYTPILSPDSLIRERPLSEKAGKTVSYSRSRIRDILDKKDAIVVRAEIPGIEREDLEITIAGDRLTLEAKREFEEKVEKEDLFRSEIAYGRLYRVVPLPVEVKGDEATAEMKDGVVEVTLPKVETITPHTVKVA